MNKGAFFSLIIKRMGIIAVLVVIYLSPSLASSAQVTDSDVAQGCQSDVLDIFDNGSNVEMHTRVESITYEVVSFVHAPGLGTEVRGHVTGTGFAPVFDQGDQPVDVLEHFHYQLPFKVWYMNERPAEFHRPSSEPDRGETLVGYLHGLASTPPGPVEVEWLGNEWLKNAMLKRGITFFAFNQTGRNEHGEFTGRLADGTPVQPIGSSPHVRNSTCALRNLIEKLRGRSFDQTLLLGHSRGATVLVELAGGYAEDGRLVGIARDSEGKPDIDGVIALAPAFGFGFFGFLDPEPAEPAISSKMMLFGFTGDYAFGREIFDATVATLRLFNPACSLSSCDPAEWMRVYHLVSPHVFADTFFDNRVFDPNGFPAATLGAPISGFVLAAVDHMIDWIQGLEEPPPSRIAGFPGELRPGIQDLVFAQDGRPAFSETSTILVPFSNVAEDFIFELPGELIRIPLVELGPLVLSSWLLVQDTLGAVREAIIPPTFKLRRATYAFFNGALVLEPFSEERLEELYGDDKGYAEALIGYLNDLTKNQLWDPDEPLFVMKDREFLSHSAGTPYHDPGIFGVHPTQGLIHPRTFSMDVDWKRPGIYPVRFEWKDHVGYRHVQVTP